MRDTLKHIGTVRRHGLDEKPKEEDKAYRQTTPKVYFLNGILSKFNLEKQTEANYENNFTLLNIVDCNYK